MVAMCACVSIITSAVDWTERVKEVEWLEDDVVEVAVEAIGGRVREHGISLKGSYLEEIKK